MKRFTTTGLSFLLFLSVGCDNRPRTTEPAPGHIQENQPSSAGVVDKGSTPKETPTEILSASPPDSQLIIQLVEDTSVWEADISNVQKVLDSAGSELMRYFPDRHVEPITVFSKGGPITLYDRDSAGGYTVRLQTGERFWSQYSYQFAHELCHVLSNYRNDKNPNGWFEESLCEAASLFVLRAMGKTWKNKPPYPNWKSYHQSLNNYAQDRIDDASLHEHRSLEEWFAQWEPKLRESVNQRKLNNIVAAKLLPLIEANPESWESISWLNVEQSFPDDTFREYLERWRHYVPERHREFVENVASEFGIAFD